MRPTYLNFRSPKERTPAFYPSYVILFHNFFRQLIVEPNFSILNLKVKMSIINGYKIKLQKKELNCNLYYQVTLL